MSRKNRQISAKVRKWGFLNCCNPWMCQIAACGNEHCYFWKTCMPIFKHAEYFCMFRALNLWWLQSPTQTLKIWGCKMFITSNSNGWIVRGLLRQHICSTRDTSKVAVRTAVRSSPFVENVCALEGPGYPYPCPYTYSYPYTWSYPYLYTYTYHIYTLEVQCWCLPTDFIDVKVCLCICVMSMFTHQCRCLPLRHVVQQIYQTFVLLPDLYLGHASLVKLMRYHFKSHVTTKRPAKEFGCCWHPDKQRKQHCILGVSWGGFFPPVNIACHRINTASRVKTAIHANFTGTSR